MARDPKRTVGEIVCNSLTRLADVYVVTIEHQPTGHEWERVGQDLSAAMDQAVGEVEAATVTADAEELVEA